MKEDEKNFFFLEQNFLNFTLEQLTKYIKLVLKII